MTSHRFAPLGIAFTALMVVRAAAGCHAERAAPTTATISSIPEDPPPARAPLGAGVSDQIERAYTREAFDAWRAKRAAEVAPASVEHRVDDIFRCLNCESLIVTERVIEAGVCRQGPWMLDIAKDEGQPTRFDAQPIATDCCDATCPDRSPAAWMLELNRILALRDEPALRALVSPADGLRAASGFSDGEDSTRDEAHVHHDGPLDQVFALVQMVQLFHDGIDCPESFDDAGEATCNVHGGGFGATYVWRRAPAGSGSAVYLLEVSQQSH